MSITQKKEEHYKMFEEKKEGEVVVAHKKEVEKRQTVIDILNKMILVAYGEHWSSEEKKEAANLITFFVIREREKYEEKAKKGGSTAGMIYDKISSDESARISFIRCIFKAISLNISSSPDDLFYIIPRKGEICFDLSYFGLLHFAYNAKLAGVCVQPVYECDKFEFCYGSNQNCVHIPDFKNRNSSEIINYYAILTLTSGQQIMECMNKHEIIKRKNFYESKGFCWNGNFSEDAMCRKTVLRKALKLAPKSKILSQVLEAEQEDFVETEQQPFKIEGDKNV